MKSFIILCVLVTTVGCATRQQIVPVSATTAVFVKANTTTTPAKREIVKNVIAIEIRRGERKVYEETFDQPLTVVDGACPRRISLPDGSMMPRLEECLVWPIDEIGSTFAYGLQSDLKVIYLFAGVVGK